MAEINFPCRMCGGKLIVIDSVITCLQCNPLTDMGVDDPDGIPGITIPFTRENIYKRDNGQCQHCGKKVTLSESVMYHKILRAHGGKNNWDNVEISCVDCAKNRVDIDFGRKPNRISANLYQKTQRKEKME